MNRGMDGWKKQCKERSSRESKKGTKEARKTRRKKGRGRKKMGKGGRRFKGKEPKEGRNRVSKEWNKEERK